MENLKRHINETVKLAVPVSIGQIGHIMMGVVDSLMVGQVGTVPLAAAALVNGLFFLVLVLGIGMTMAITPLVAISKGANNVDDCGMILRQALLVNMVFALLLLAMIFFGADLIQYMNQPPEVVAEARSYMKILALSVIPFLLFQVYRQFLEGISVVKPPMIIAVLANLFNAFSNWCLIFGNLGFPALGLDGAGISTFLTRTIMAFVLMFYVINSKKFAIYNPTLKYKTINLKVIKKVIAIGLPSGLQYFLEVGAFSFSAIMIGWLGAVPLAAHQIAINLASVTYMIVLGIGAAGTIRVGSALGKRDYKNMRRAGFTAIGIAISLMFCFAIIFIVLRNFLPTLYVDDIPVIELASTLLIVAALFQLFDGTQATAIGVLRGLTDVKIPLIISFGAYWLLGVPVGYILAFTFELGTMGIWLGFLVGLASVAISLTMRFNHLSKKELSV
ncbi:MAG: MATE family efflux transporter [Ignavibacteriales bacterium]|jgi:MATE family multidrug resistance protein|nr:MAG: MATE family efflux transporter [Ignavibacteriales bacterium]